MKLFWVAVFCVIFPSACIGVDRHPEIEVDNMLSGCFKIESPRFEEQGNIILLNASISVVESIGNCGCKSAAVYYESIDKATNQTLSHGIISSLVEGNRKFVVNADKTIFGKNGFTLKISCSN